MYDYNPLPMPTGAKGSSCREEFEPAPGSARAAAIAAVREWEEAQANRRAASAEGLAQERAAQEAQEAEERAANSRMVLARQEKILSRPSRLGPDGTRYDSALMPGDQPGWAYWSDTGLSVAIPDADLPAGTTEISGEFSAEGD